MSKIACGVQKCTYELGEDQIKGELMCFKDQTVPDSRNGLELNLKHVIDNLNVAFPGMNYRIEAVTPCMIERHTEGITLNIIMKKLIDHATIELSKIAMRKMIESKVLDIDLKYIGYDGIKENENYMINGDVAVPIDIHPMTTLLLNETTVNAEEIFNKLEYCIKLCKGIIPDVKDKDINKITIDYFSNIMDSSNYKVFLIHMSKICRENANIDTYTGKYIIEKIQALTPSIDTTELPPGLKPMWGNNRPPAGGKKSRNNKKNTYKKKKINKKIRPTKRRRHTKRKTHRKKRR